MSLILPNLPDLLDAAASEAGALVASLQATVLGRVQRDGRLDRVALDAEQHAAHGLAWAAAYAETLRQTAIWARELGDDFGEAEALPAQLLAHEYLSQLAGGLPMNQGEMANGNYGRDHHMKAFSIWMAGGGIKPGITIGGTDDLGYNAVEDPVTVNDFQATVMHSLGIDHEKLTFRFQGRDFRLTDVAGEVVKKLLA